MAIEAGQQLLHYRLIEKIGEGGMGVVWNAQDTKLGREVALKFLSASFAADSDRLKRFEREARLLATLNHANIGTLHGFEEAEGERFLVLELIHGEGLDERLARGRLPLAEVVSICRQIAEALDAAHERGVFHRDLKPANIKVTPESVVKVLDFGLAKTQEPEAVSGDLSASPTLTAQMTAAGVILGTAAYMSPEQARGRPTDKRTDIWSFGCILYELLAGRKAFSGETVSDNIAAILTGEPDAAGLPADTPPRLRELLARCLEKDRRRRLRDIGDARIELEKVEAGDTGTVSTIAAGPLRRWLPLAVVLVAGLGIGAFLRGWQAPEAAKSVRHPTRLSVVVPADQTVVGLTMSPDGESLIYKAESTDAQGGTSTRLYHRRLDAFETTAVPESENAAWVTFSPDSRRIAYLTNATDGTSTIKKVSLDGGPVIELLELSTPPGRSTADWWSDDELIVSLNHGGTLARLPADGGEPEEILTLEGGQLWSSLVAVHDGRTLLMGVLEALEEGISFRMEALDLETNERRVILEDGLGGPMPAVDQFLIWRDYTWFLAPFDLERLAFTGPETPLFTNRNASVARNGTMAYVPSFRSTSDSVVLVDREGQVEVLTEVDGGAIVELRWSPDGRKIALLTSDIGRVRRRLWTLDVARGNLTPLPSGEAWKDDISWTPAGDGLMMTQVMDNVPRIVKRGSRPGDGWEPVFADGPPQQWTDEAAWSADGSVMAFASGEEGSPPDLWLLPSEEGAEPRPFIESASPLTRPAISPDGKWIAFTSNESGAQEIYVAPLAGKDPARAMLRISDRGGSDPVWSRDGSELFFEEPSGRLMAAAVKRDGGAEEFGVPEVVLDLKALGLTTEHEGSYDVSPDGSRFVFGRGQGGAAGGSEIFVVLDWFAELE